MGAAVSLGGYGARVRRIGGTCRGSAWYRLSVLLIAVTMATPTAHADDREQTIRGALVAKFGRFAQWPDTASGGIRAFVIGILNDPSLADLIRSKVEGQTVHGLPVSVRDLRDPAAARECHVLFISPTAPSELDLVLRVLGTAPVLTVGSQSGFLEAGGIINLVTDQDRIRFAVNLAASRRAGVELDARLLRIAQRVVGES